jgi:hypothetical protein
MKLIYVMNSNIINIKNLFQFIKEVEFLPSNPTTGNFYVSQYRATQPLSSHQKFDDPSEPIYTDPSLFERSRSLRSLTVSNLGKVQSQEMSD